MTVRRLHGAYEEYRSITAVVMPDGYWWRPGWRRGRIAGWLPTPAALPEAPEPLLLNEKADAWAAKRRMVAT